jgi:hypothetical protein
VERLIRFLSKHSWAVVYICLGALLGICSKLPLGWRLPDLEANVLGGAVGAVGSVAAAFLVLQRQIEQQRADKKEAAMDARKKMATFLRPAIHSFHSMFSNLPQEMNPYFRQIDEIQIDLNQWKSSCEINLPILAALDTQGLEFVVITKIAVERLSGELGKLRVSVGLQPGFIGSDDYFECVVSLKTQMNQILDDATMFTGDDFYRRMKLQ